MIYEVKTIEVFERQAKRLIKKYPSLKFELLSLVHSLKENPLQGTSMGNNCYKVRLAIASKGKGKSGSARVITHVTFLQNTLYLLTIYDKTEKENLATNELKKLLNEI
ncbi:MAG: type II toxin-antitoxin system RelE/ParE family toxin [Segetibacter sp.]|nr:type II toxin-antitoxin system RelE/ParE family toxin [Segetibacter sp.]